LDYNTHLRVHSSFAKASHACHPLNEPFDADADEARLGHHLMDLFSWRRHFEESESKEDIDQAKFLERQFDLSDAIWKEELTRHLAVVPNWELRTSNHTVVVSNFCEFHITRGSLQE
jgi:hypothetical protein